MIRQSFRPPIPELKIRVREPGASVQSGWNDCEINRDIKFSPAALESYAFSKQDPVVFDAMLLAASVEFADMSCRRPQLGWARRLKVRIPVDDPIRWASPAVLKALKDAVEFVTGDYWSFSFYKREFIPDDAIGDRLKLFPPSKAVVAFSAGMDSLAVASLAESRLGGDLVRVRVGGANRSRGMNRSPFIVLPYRVTIGNRRNEPSARSRGFKFALISGLAACLTRAEQIIVPESGQGVLGPPLVSLGHAYPDYRNHPQFTCRMEQLIERLLDQTVQYRFPRMWNTKAETLSSYITEFGDKGWRSTKSCWRNNRWSSVQGSWRHCGVCAACMLRRQSVHAAGFSEPPKTYVCTNLGASTLESAVDPEFKRLNPAFRKYAIAGVRHMEELAHLPDCGARRIIERHSTSLKRTIPHVDRTEELLVGLFERHAVEWNGFLHSLGANSFVKQWL